MSPSRRSVSRSRASKPKSARACSPANSRSVRLTAAGEVLVPLAQRILADVETAQAELDVLGGLRRGRLRLGLIQTSGSAIDLAEVMGGQDNATALA